MKEDSMKQATLLTEEFKSFEGEICEKGSSEKNLAKKEISDQSIETLLQGIPKEIFLENEETEKIRKKVKILETISKQCYENQIKKL